MFVACAACGCHMGKVRANNEDNFYFDGLTLSDGNTGLPEAQSLSVPLDWPVTMAVFDGMGGEHYGEVASRIAAESLKSALDRDPRADLVQMCQNANLKICQEASRRGVTAMGSTAVILRLSDARAEVVNVGDSKAFRLRKGELRQISTDHTDASFLLELGVTNRRPRLTQNLGVDPEEMVIEPSVAAIELQDGDVFLLCSDGLTDMATPEEIQSVLSRATTPKETVERLLSLALAHGGRDNITVIICRVCA